MINKVKQKIHYLKIYKFKQILKTYNKIVFINNLMIKKNRMLN